MRKFLPLIPLLAVFALSSCSSTFKNRIEKNPDIYNALSVEEQELVSNGQIAEGMSPSGVYLALGSPERRLEGSSKGVRTMRWDYTSLSPVYGNHFNVGFGSRGRFGRGGFGHGFGRGRFGRGRRGFGSFGFGSSVNYIPTRSATVWFENEKVRSWEKIR